VSTGVLAGDGIRQRLFGFSRLFKDLDSENAVHGVRVTGARIAPARRWHGKHLEHSTQE
jgi:hypothetical protein